MDPVSVLLLDWKEFLFSYEDLHRDLLTNWKGSKWNHYLSWYRLNQEEIKWIIQTFQSIWYNSYFICLKDGWYLCWFFLCDGLLISCSAQNALAGYFKFTLKLWKIVVEVKNSVNFVLAELVAISLLVKDYFMSDESVDGLVC